jgi:drug/metabolite transporter (DMT)-like permease
LYTPNAEWISLQIIVVGGAAALFSFILSQNSNRVAVAAIAWIGAVLAALVLTVAGSVFLSRRINQDWEALPSFLAVSFLAGATGGAVGLWWARQYRHEG